MSCWVIACNVSVVLAIIPDFFAFFGLRSNGSGVNLTDSVDRVCSWKARSNEEKSRSCKVAPCWTQAHEKALHDVIIFIGRPNKGCITGSCHGNPWRKQALLMHTLTSSYNATEWKQHILKRICFSQNSNQAVELSIDDDVFWSKTDLNPCSNIINNMSHLLRATMWLWTRSHSLVPSTCIPYGSSAVLEWSPWCYC